MTEQIIKEKLNSANFQDRIEGIQQFANSRIEASKLVPFFDIASKDFHQEVRIEAAKNILLCPSKFSVFIEDPFDKVRVCIINQSVELENAGQTVVDILAKRVSDHSPEVRTALAKIVPKLFPQNSSDAKKNNLIEITKNLLLDPDDDVKYYAAIIIQECTISFGFEYLFDNFSLLFHQILADPQWRVRKVGIELMFSLAYVSEFTFFKGHLFQFILKFLQDPCFKVRKFAVSCLPALVQHFDNNTPDSPFLTKDLIPELKKHLAEQPNFIERETYILCISALAGLFKTEYQSNYVFQPMIKMLKESESTQYYNVSILAIDHLKKHHTSIHSFRKQYELKPILKKLITHPEVTIKQRAEQFLREISE